MEVQAPMAASGTLPQPVFSRKSPVSKSGVLTLFGFGIKVRMHCGHLEIEDGIGPERRKIRLARVGHGLKRLVVIGSDGFISLAALQWLADQDASFVMLERDGCVLATTGPVRPSEAKLRRAQALAYFNGAALRISRELILRKLSGQEDVARHKLLDTRTADTIARFRSELPNADNINSIRLIESQAARVYWSAWRTLPINFPKNDLSRIPDHWRSFGARVSPLTGSPRLAANPANSILNYLYSVLESEATLAAAALGLDPGLGVLHVDTSARDSLACDLMEPARSQVDAYVLDWVTRLPLRRDWFVEQSNGNCRMTTTLAVRLSETAATWRLSVAPIAEWVARAIWSTIRNPDTPFTTRLTQANKRQVKGKTVPSSIPAIRFDNLCLSCGKAVAKDVMHCTGCANEVRTDRMRALAQRGRIASKSPESKTKLAATQRLQRKARKDWDASTQPDWLNDQVYSTKIRPLLLRCSLSQISNALGVSIPYASDIRKGRRRPHARHWLNLASLVGLERRMASMARSGYC
jgi:CRISPR-associated endonuclease Cas1